MTSWDLLPCRLLRQPVRGSGVQGLSLQIGCGVLACTALVQMPSAAVQACEITLLHVLQVLTSTYEKGLFHFWDKDSWCGCPDLMLPDVQVGVTIHLLHALSAYMNTRRHACTHES